MIKILEFLKKTQILSKPYRALVLFNEDPLKLGRIKVRIPGLIDGSLDKLPWIYCEDTVSMGGRSDISSTMVPVINSEVIVEFPTEDIYAGFYTGRWSSNETHNGNFNEDYPHSYGFSDDAGFQFRVNKAKGFSEVRASSGARLRFEKDSTIEMRSSKGIKFVSEDGKTTIFLDLQSGEMKLDPKEKITLSGNEATIDAQKTNIITGELNQTVSGSYIEKSLGGKKELISGPKVTSIAGSYGETIAAGYTKLIGGKASESYATGIEQTVALGGILTKLILGNRDINLLLGNYAIDIKAGNYSVDIIAGNVSMKTKVGNFELGNLLGQIEIGIDGSIKINATTTFEVAALVSASIEGTAFCDIKGALVNVEAKAIASVKGPLVKLGPGASPVLTMATNPVVDLITGVPSIGVFTVLA